MSTVTTMNSRRSRSRGTAAALVGVAILAASCAGERDTSPQVEIGTRLDSVPALDEAATPPAIADGLEYGDTIGEVDATARPSHDAEPTAGPLDEALPGFTRVAWNELIAPGVSPETIYQKYELKLAKAAPGSPEKNAIYDEMNAEYASASVNAELDGQPIQLAGFATPLSFGGDTITEFLLVPTFGACIHVPPPPANQTILVTLAPGEEMPIEDTWGPIWVAGELAATSSETNLATAGFTLTDAQFGSYQSG